MALGASIGLGLLLGCRSDSRPTPGHRRVAPAADAGWRAPASIRSVLPDDFAALLARRPAQARLWVALRAPAAWIDGLATLMPWLRDVPDLGPRVARLEQSLSAWLGAWPPRTAAWRQLGVEPEGGVVFAQVAPGSQAGGWWLGVVSTAPERLLARLAGKPVGAAHTVSLPWGTRVHCRAGARLLECASAQALLDGPRASAPANTAPGVGAAPGGAAAPGGPAGSPRPDALVGFRGGRFRLRAILWREATGLRITARLEGSEVRDLAGVLASPGVLPPPPNEALAALFFRLDPSGLSSVLGWLPVSYASVRPRQGRSWALAELAATSAGSWWLSLGPRGWCLGSPRQGGPEPFPLATEVTLGGRFQLFVQTGPGALLLGSSPRACAAPRWMTPGGSASGSPGGSGFPGASGSPGGAAPHGPSAAAPAVPPAAPLAPAPAPAPAFTPGPTASLALWIALSDPLEWLGGAARARALAALLGLGEAERAVVALARVLATGLGEILLRVSPSPRGLSLELRLRSPFAGPEPARQDFRLAWQEKWRTGGYFSPRTLGRLARAHPGTAVGHLAGRLGGLSLDPVLQASLLEGLFAGAGLLRAPEVPCGLLAARLGRCLEDFGRQTEPERWLLHDRLRQLGEAGELRLELRQRARKATGAFTSHCDDRRGRLEDAPALGRCLTLPGCAPFVSCLIFQLSPAAHAPPQRPGSPR